MAKAFDSDADWVIGDGVYALSVMCCALLSSLRVCRRLVDLEAVN